MIPVIYEDKNLIIIDKPYGISSQSLPELYKDEYGKDVFLVHRLDQVTRGLMVLAKNSRMAGLISEKLGTAEFKMAYLCLMQGEIHNEGVLEDCLYHDRKKNKTYVVKKRPGAKLARLGYKLISFKENISLVHIVLETGRTHQIRAQFSNIGHPLVGDGKYGSRINGDVALCSFRLSFIHPLTKEKLCFSILPEMKQRWKLFEKELAFFGIES